MAYESHLHSAFWQKTKTEDSSSKICEKDDEDYDEDCEEQSDDQEEDEEISVT